VAAKRGNPRHASTVRAGGISANYGLEDLLQRRLVPADQGIEACCLLVQGFASTYWHHDLP
jgi:hypothetical protein